MSPAHRWFLVFLLLVATWTVAWAVVALRTGAPVSPYAVVVRGANRIRSRLFYVLGALLGIAFGLSLYYFPYRAFAASRLGPPSVVVSVTAKQWLWQLSRTTLPVHAVVEFDVTAVDVNHGFAVYGPNGALVAQVQAMPGYTNKLLVAFDQPGEYTVRCLEFCGAGHHLMTTSFRVE